MTTNGSITLPYSDGLNIPRRTSSADDHISDERLVVVFISKETLILKQTVPSRALSYRQPIKQFRHLNRSQTRKILKLFEFVRKAENLYRNQPSLESKFVGLYYTLAIGQTIFSSTVNWTSVFLI